MYEIIKITNLKDEKYLFKNNSSIYLFDKYGKKGLNYYHKLFNNCDEFISFYVENLFKFIKE